VLGLLAFVFLVGGPLPSPGFLDLDAAAEFLQHKLPRVVVDDEDTVLLVGPLVPFEHRHGRCGALEETMCWDAWYKLLIM